MVHTSIVCKARECCIDVIWRSSQVYSLWACSLAPLSLIRHSDFIVWKRGKSYPSLVGLDSHHVSVATGKEQCSCLIWSSQVQNSNSPWDVWGDLCAGEAAAVLVGRWDIHKVIFCNLEWSNTEELFCACFTVYNSNLWQENINKSHLDYF